VKGLKIKEILKRNRRDFKSVFECEGCGNTEERWGYDDDNFHQIVIPGLKCSVCGKTGAECGAEYQPLQPKYPEGMQV
jgi:transcription elongation factor Elf1